MTAPSRVQIITVDGSTVTIDKMSGEDVMELVEAFRSTDVALLQFSLDDGSAQVYLRNVNVARIDVEDAE